MHFVKYWYDEKEDIVKFQHSNVRINKKLVMLSN